MKAGNKTKTEKLTLKLKTRFILKVRIIVAAVVGCLMVAPLTRAYKLKTANKALHLTAILLRFIAAGVLCRYMLN